MYGFMPPLSPLYRIERMIQGASPLCGGFAALASSSLCSVLTDKGARERGRRRTNEVAARREARREKNDYVRDGHDDGGAAWVSVRARPRRSHRNPPPLARG